MSEMTLKPNEKLEIFYLSFGHIVTVRYHRCSLIGIIVKQMMLFAFQKSVVKFQN